MFHPLGRFTRRRAIGAASVGAGAVAMAACGTTGAGSTVTSAVNTGLPKPIAGAIQLKFQANTQGYVQWNRTTQRVYQEFVDANFNRNPLYKGIWATAFPWGNGSAQVTADIAGSGAEDIWELCCGDVPTMIHSGFAQELDTLMKTDNIPKTWWSAGHIEANSLAGKLYGIPSYDGTMTCIYRQDVLDQLGLSYPSPDWNYTEALRLWQQCTGTNKQGKHRTGVNIYYHQEDLDWWLYGWGAREMNAQQDRATMDSPGGVACFTFLQEMFKDGITRPESRGVKNLLDGSTVFQMAHSAYVINAAVELADKVKWDFQPNPYWGGGKRACMMTIDCNMMNAATKHPKETWELFKWLNLGAPKGTGYDYAWPKFQIKINLITPSLVSLWDYWETTVKTVAPSLRNKALKWWADPAIKGYARPQLFYQYDWAQASGVEQNWMTQIQQQKVDAALGLKQMQQQVNAAEAAGKLQTAVSSSATKAFPVHGSPVASVTPGL